MARCSARWPVDAAPRGQRARRVGGLDERADQRGGQQPGALVDGVGVGAQLGRDRRDGDEAAGVGRRGDDDRMLVAGARERELRRAVVELASQQRPQLPVALARRVRRRRRRPGPARCRSGSGAWPGADQVRLSVASRTLVGPDP